MKLSKNKMTILSQSFKLIPRNLIPKIDNVFGIYKQSRGFSPMGHVLVLISGQLMHAQGRNDICDILRNHDGLMNCVPLKRNDLSHAKRKRDAGMAEKLFWKTFTYCDEISLTFRTQGWRYGALPKRFTRIGHVAGSTTIPLIFNRQDRAKHCRRKAVAKMHLRLDLRFFSSNFILVITVGTYDSAEAAALCKGSHYGVIVSFDKAHANFKHLRRLSQYGVLRSICAKDCMKYNGVGLHRILKLNILRDVVSKLTRKCTFVWYPESLHLIGAIVDVDGKLKRMTFITDNFIGAAHFICNLYKVRRAIAVLLKEIKQILQVIDFIGCNENAVCRQIWTNLPTYILHRFIEWQKEWKHTCAGWFSVLCGVIWRRLYMGSFFPRCGTASDPDRIRGVPGFASV